MRHILMTCRAFSECIDHLWSACKRGTSVGLPHPSLVLSSEVGKDCIANATVRSANKGYWADYFERGGRGRGQAISPVVLESRGSPTQTLRKSIAAQTFRVPTTFAAIVFLCYWWVTCFYFIQFGIVIALVV